MIEKALKISGSRYLNNYDIWVTLEPCIMCASIIKQTRIRRLYYGAEDKKGGAIDNGVRLFSNCKSKTKLEVYSGFSENTSQKLLKDFFREMNKFILFYIFSVKTLFPIYMSRVLYAFFYILEYYLQ